MEVECRDPPQSAGDASEIVTAMDVTDARLEISEMRTARAEQDALIATLMEDNAQLSSTVEILESKLCRLQSQFKRLTRNNSNRELRASSAEINHPTNTINAPEETTEKTPLEALLDENNLPEDIETDYITLKEHAHCTVEICWRQKYTESLGQLRAVLVELRNELEERSVPEEPVLNEEARRPTSKASKVQLIEESIRTLDVGESDPSTMSRSRTGSRKRSFLGFDSSLRRVKQSRNSGSDTSLSKTPLIKKMLNLFKKKPTSSSRTLPPTQT